MRFAMELVAEAAPLEHAEDAVMNLGRGERPRLQLLSKLTVKAGNHRYCNNSFHGLTAQVDCNYQ